MRLNYRQIEHEKSPVEDMMPIITCKVTDEEKELIDRLAGTNRSDYMRRCLLAGSGGRIGGLSQVTEQINEVNRRLDILFDQVSEIVTTQVAASRSDDAARIPGNRDGDPAAFDGDSSQYEIRLGRAGT